jgi:hypothetical protein
VLAHARNGGNVLSRRELTQMCQFQHAVYAEQVHSGACISTGPTATGSASANAPAAALINDENIDLAPSGNSSTKGPEVNPQTLPFPSTAAAPASALSRRQAGRLDGATNGQANPTSNSPLVGADHRHA